MTIHGAFRIGLLVEKLGKKQMRRMGIEGSTYSRRWGGMSLLEDLHTVWGVWDSVLCNLCAK